MNCTGKRCLVQYNKIDPATCTAVPYCPQATPPKTNADRIRSMTDEELATFIEEASCPPTCYRTHIYECRKEDCAPCWLAWLQAEVKE